MTVHRCQSSERPLDATVTLPGSKSLTNRALVAAALADGTSVLRGILLADDTRLMIEALRGLGIAVAVDEARCLAEVMGCRGLIPVSEARIECGNAGTVMRFVAALCALGEGRYELDGVARMRERPIGDLVEALQSMRAGVEYLGAEGYPPITVHAHGLRGGQFAFASPASSQFVSAVLLVAPYAQRDVLLEVAGGVTSAPYLRMTCSVMDAFGVVVVEQYADHGAKFIVEATQRYRPTTYAVEPDASNATYFLAAPAVAGGRVTVESLGTDSVQGDARFIDVLERMGCGVERSPRQLTVHGPSEGRKLGAIDIDLSDMPDTVQTLAVIALFAEGSTHIRNVANLRLKETDRLAALTRELTKLGATIEQEQDGLIIHPPAKITPASIDTYDDHRMAMSFALAGLRCPGITINDPECVAKTFPDFFQTFAGFTAGSE